MSGMSPVASFPCICYRTEDYHCVSVSHLFGSPYLRESLYTSGLVSVSPHTPKLYYAETDDQLTYHQPGGLLPLVPHLKMIVMEFVLAQTAGKAFAPRVKSGDLESQTETAPDNFFQDIANAIKILQKENLVFGDVRTVGVVTACSSPAALYLGSNI